MKEDVLEQERDFQMTSNHFQCKMFASIISSISMDLAECCHGQKGHSWMHCQQRANLLQSTWSVKDGAEKNIQSWKMISSVKSKGKREEEIQRTPLQALDSKGSTRELGYQEPKWDGNTKGSSSWAQWSRPGIPAPRRLRPEHHKLKEKLH